MPFVRTQPEATKQYGLRIEKADQKPQVSRRSAPKDNTPPKRSRSISWIQASAIQQQIKGCRCQNENNSPNEIQWQQPPRPFPHIRQPSPDSAAPTHQKTRYGGKQPDIEIAERRYQAPRFRARRKRQMAPNDSKRSDPTQNIYSNKPRTISLRLVVNPHHKPLTTSH